MSELRTKLTTGELDVPLDELDQAATEQFQQTYNGGDFDPAQADRLRALADVAVAAREEHQAQQAVRDEVAALADVVDSPTTGGDTDDSDGDDGDQGGEVDSAGGETVENTAEADPAEPETPDPAPTEEPKPEQVPEPEPSTPNTTSDNPSEDLVTASGNTPSAADINAHRPAGSDAAPRQLRKRYSIVAGADVPDTPTGKTLTTGELAESTLARFRAMPIGQPGLGEVRKSIATINRGYPADMIASGNDRYSEADQALIDTVSNEQNLPGGSVLAAARQQASTVTADGMPGGPVTATEEDIWCSPSQVSYELCPPLATRSGMLDLPSLGIQRGGIRYPIWWQFPDQHMPPESNQPDAAQDPGRNSWHGYQHGYDRDTGEDQRIGPNFFQQNNKKCIKGPCARWAEQRQNLAYLCVTGDILREYTYPELAERFISDALLSHAHYMNEIYIDYIMKHSQALDVFDASTDGYGVGSVAEAVLERLGFLVTWFRTTYRMAFNATLEGFAPFWLREFLKLDLERKTNRPHGTVSNAEIDAIFAQWGARIQWVYDHPEDLDHGNAYPNGVTNPPQPPAGVMPGADNGQWPNEVTLTLYPAGAWTLFEDNIIRLDALYDSTKLATNEYTALFTEDAWMLLNRCQRSFNVKLTGLCANGAVGPRRDACAPDAGAQAVYLSEGPGTSENDAIFTQSATSGQTASTSSKKSSS